MYRKLLTLLLACFAIANSGIAQYSTDFIDWGKGFVGPAMMNGKYQRLEGLKLYRNAGGFAIGKIKRDDFGSTGLAFAEEASDPETIAVTAFIEVGYEQSGLIWYERMDGFVRVGMDANFKGYWLKEDELERAGMRVSSYMEFFSEKKPTLFPKAMGINLNFRSAPSIQGRVLATLNSDHYFVTPTGKTSGFWAEVTVIQYNAPYCEVSEVEESKVKTWTGWIKIIDNKGHPNIWFYTRGC